MTTTTRERFLLEFLKGDPLYDRAERKMSIERHLAHVQPIFNEQKILLCKHDQITVIAESAQAIDCLPMELAATVRETAPLSSDQSQLMPLNQTHIDGGIIKDDDLRKGSREYFSYARAFW